MQMANFGPMLGQTGHFVKYGHSVLKDLPEEERTLRLQYGRDRYVTESKRLFGVLEKQLEDKQYVTGDQITIADFAIYPWIAGVKFYGIENEYSQYKNVWAYSERLDARPAVQRGKTVTPLEAPKPGQFVPSAPK